MKELSLLKKHIGYSYISRVINLLIVPIQVSILTKNIKTDIYGILVLLQSSFMMFTFFATLGIQKFISIKIPGKLKYTQYVYFKSLLVLEMILYVFFSFFLVIFNENILKLLDIEEYKKELFLFLLVYFFSLLYNEFGRFLNYRKKITTRVVLGIFEKIMELFFLIFVIKMLHKNDIFHIAITYLVLYVLLTIIYSKYSLNYSIFFDVKIKKIILKKAILFSLPLLVSDISWRLMQNIDFYFLSGMHMKKELGIYAFIVKLLNYIYLAGSPIIWVMYPYVTSAFNQKHKINKKVKFFIQKQFNFSFLFLTFSMGILLTNLEFFVLLLSKQEFLNFKKAYYLYAMYPILLTIMYIQQQILLLKGKTIFIGLIYFLGLCLNIFLNFLLVKVLNMYGIIIGTIISILFIVFIQQKDNILINFKTIIFPFLVLFLIYLIKFYLINNIILLNVMFFIIFILFAFFFKVIRIKDIKIIQNKLISKG